jgi:hypothetical protein
MTRWFYCSLSGWSASLDPDVCSSDTPRHLFFSGEPSKDPGAPPPCVIEPEARTPFSSAASKTIFRPPSADRYMRCRFGLCRDQLRLTSSRVVEIGNQFGGSASEISCASLASAKTSSRITRIVT